MVVQLTPDHLLPTLLRTYSYSSIGLSESLVSALAKNLHLPMQWRFLQQVHRNRLALAAAAVVARLTSCPLL